jgi:Lon protease-like protein
MIGLQPGAVLDRVPLFPLPNLVFFPNTLLPLHVFEPRYLELVAHVAAADRIMGVVQLRPGWQEDYYGAPPLYPEFTLGRLMHDDEDDEGRRNILLRGLHRARILQEDTAGTPYRTVKAVLLDPGASDRRQLSRSLVTVRQLFASILVRIPDLELEQADSLFAPDAPPTLVLDSIASALPLAPSVKQELLAEARPDVRASLLSEHLASYLAEHHGGLDSAAGSEGA